MKVPSSLFTGYRGLKAFIGVRKGGAHFMAKTKKMPFGTDEKGARIKVVQHLRNFSQGCPKRVPQKGALTALGLCVR